MDINVEEFNEELTLIPKSKLKELYVAFVDNTKWDGLTHNVKKNQEIAAYFRQLIYNVK